MTLAHEVGHACKRQDIYVTGGALSIVGEVVEQEKMPYDWANNYHPPGMTQDVVIKRLLMYGNPNSSGTRIPRGSIYGIGNTNYMFKTGMWNVGLEGISPPKDSQ